MDKTLTRRTMLGRAGLVLGGAITLGVLNACGDDSTPATPTPEPTPTPTETPAALKTTQFPYQQHLPAGYQLDVAAVREAAYHNYYAGGCCHGSYNALLKHLAETAGAPFSELPLDFGIFGGGGIAGYGSICGAVLGGIFIINSIVPNVADPAPAKANVRNRMMVELMRWYEGAAFPQYVPSGIDSHETGVTKDFGAANLPVLQTVAGSHLCHASVTTWCAANGNANPNGADKKARCSRLTADVTGKIADMLNGYLATGEFVGAAAGATTASCTSCHGAVAQAPAAPTASGMECVTCHSETEHPLPAGHDPITGCADCH